MKRVILSAALGLILCNAYAYTPAEQRQLEQVRTYVRQGQVEYKAAADAAAQASKEAADADANSLASQKYALDADKKIGVLGVQINDAAKREAADVSLIEKMKPLYDKVRGPWWAPGLGAIIYGVERLTLFAVIAGVVVVILIVGAVIVFPAIIPFLEMVGLAIMRVFEFLGSLLSTGLRAIVAKLRKAPVPSTPAPAPVPTASPTVNPPSAVTPIGT